MPYTADLLPERFSSLHRHLMSSDIEQDILGRPAKTISSSDLAYLMSVASRLALSGDLDSESASADCQLAYDIAVRAPRFASGSLSVVEPLCELILSRIGNFPARRLLQEKRASINYLQDPFLEIENIVRQEENSTVHAPAGMTLTDFQVRLLHALRETTNVSVSAPTSAGKSFTLELELLQRLKENNQYTAIFLVPTRALIRQVSLDLLDLLHKNEVKGSVLSSFSVPENSETNSNRKLIFVLTQERFATLLAEASPSFKIDVIVVDEAQEIGKDRRGITLERVIRLAIRRYPRVRLFFSSPLRSNPEYLLSLFQRPSSESVHFVEHQRPVTQNLIRITKVDGKPYAAKVELLNESKVISLGDIEIPFKFRQKYMARFVSHFTATEDVSILYCNRPSTADKAASELSDLVEDAEDGELNEFGAFLREEIHHYYRLAKMVRRGVAFHYANIPQIVRARIEELAKARKLRFICCTSTLLQGVNLPAKNIFLENPKNGARRIRKNQIG